MYAVVDFQQLTLRRPNQRFLFLRFKSLELLDYIQFKLNGNPTCKFERNILMGIGTAIASGFGNPTNGICYLNPFLQG